MKKTMLLLSITSLLVLPGCSRWGWWKKTKNKTDNAVQTVQKKTSPYLTPNK